MLISGNSFVRRLLHGRPDDQDSLRPDTEATRSSSATTPPFAAHPQGYVETCPLRLLGTDSEQVTSRRPHAPAARALAGSYVSRGTICQRFGNALHSAIVHARHLMARVTLVQLPSLVYWRIQRGLTQEQLAERVAMRRSTVWRIETGHHTRVRTAHLLARALSIPF